MSFSYFIKDETATTAVISFEGNLMEKYEAADLLDDVDDQIDSGRNNFILDFAQLKFLSSSGLGVVLSILTRSRKNSGDVILLNVTEKLKSLLTITRLDHVFLTAGNLTEALNSFGNKNAEN
jgi:anti-sigma B factor antagonist